MNSTSTNDNHLINSHRSTDLEQQCSSNSNSFVVDQSNSLLKTTNTYRLVLNSNCTRNTIQDCPQFTRSTVLKNFNRSRQNWNSQQYNNRLKTIKLSNELVSFNSNSFSNSCSFTRENNFNINLNNHQQLQKNRNSFIRLDLSHTQDIDQKPDEYDHRNDDNFRESIGNSNNNTLLMLNNDGDQQARKSIFSPLQGSTMLMIKSEDKLNRNTSNMIDGFESKKCDKNSDKFLNKSNGVVLPDTNANGNDELSRNTFCPLCENSRSFCSSSSVTRHLRSVHHLNDLSVTKFCFCLLCSNFLQNSNTLYEHLEQSHNITVRHSNSRFYYSKYFFNTFEDFLQWKVNQLEPQTGCHYERCFTYEYPRSIYYKCSAIRISSSLSMENGVDRNCLILTTANGRSLIRLNQQNRTTSTNQNKSQFNLDNCGKFSDYETNTNSSESYFSPPPMASYIPPLDTSICIDNSCDSRMYPCTSSIRIIFHSSSVEALLFPVHIGHSLVTSSATSGEFCSTAVNIKSCDMFASPKDQSSLITFNSLTMTKTLSTAADILSSSSHSSTIKKKSIDNQTQITDSVSKFDSKQFDDLMMGMEHSKLSEKKSEYIRESSNEQSINSDSTISAYSDTIPYSDCYGDGENNIEYRGDHELNRFDSSTATSPVFVSPRSNSSSTIEANAINSNDVNNGLTVIPAHQTNNSKHNSNLVIVSLEKGLEMVQEQIRPRKDELRNRFEQLLSSCLTQSDIDTIEYSLQEIQKHFQHE